MSKKKVVIIRGLPGCGKTTMALSFADRGYKHCEADHYFFNDGVYEYDASKINEAHEYCRNKAISELERGGKVVIANTFTRKWEIKELLESLPVDFRDIEILVCHGGTGNDKNIPAFKLEQMKHRWESHPKERHVQLDPNNMKRVISFNG